VSRLSSAEIAEIIAEEKMNDVKKPENNISRGVSAIQNDWTKSPTRTLANGMNLSERLKAAHAALTKANAAKQT